MVATNLEFLILAKDQASEAFEKVSGAVEKQRGAMEKLKVVGTIAATALVAGVAKFSSDSVEAYSEAEQKQALLAEAFKKFPNLADTNIDKLNELNDAIQRKTGYDNDDLAASQATLAQYGLTGAQIAKLTPLVADYAAKTGKDLPTATDAIGKAMLGQGRALKEVGVNFKDTHTAAGNFQELMTGLGAKVGGVADALGNTASGKVKILQKSFEDFQEKIGSMLVPILTTLADVGQKVMDWMAKNPAVVQVLAIVVGVLTVAVIALTVAMWALSLTPVALIIGAIVLAIGILIAVIVLLVTHWKEVVKFLTDVWNGFCTFIATTLKQMGDRWNGTWTQLGNQITTTWKGFVTWITNVWNGFVSWLVGGLSQLSNWWSNFWRALGAVISNIWNSYIVNPIRNAVGWVHDAISNGLNAINDIWGRIWGGLGGIVKGVFNGVIGSIEAGVNGAIDLINGMIGAVNSVGGAVGIHLGTIPHVHIPRFASGTDFAPGGLSLVGENGPELMNVPRGAQITPNGHAAPISLDDASSRRLAGHIAQAIYPLIMRGAQQTVLDALGG